MSARTWFALAIALPLTAMIWYPGWMAAALVGTLVASTAGTYRAFRTPRARPGWVKTTPERGPRTRWIPGMGLGFNLFNWHPFAFLTVWRWRR